LRGPTIPSASASFPNEYWPFAKPTQWHEFCQESPATSPGAVKTLGFPDQHYLNSALGWLELGNPAEARNEAEQISLPGRTHLETFLVRWRIAARADAWHEAHRLSTVFTRARPHLAAGWICLSYSLYRLSRPLEAWMQLLPQTSRFPKISAIPYMLACYAWEMGNKKLASKFLTRSAALGGPVEVKGAALDADDVDFLTAPSSTACKQSSAPLHISQRF
jgi:hypothetical protein